MLYYIRYRLLVHLAAFLIGVFSFSWMLLGLCAFAHHFISPAQTTYIKGDVDIDEFGAAIDEDALLAFARTVRILTIQSSLFSGLSYLVGMGIGYLFR